MSYATHLLIITSIYAVLAISLDLVVGLAGLLSLAHAAFFGIGAYSTALLTRAGLSPAFALVIGVVVSAVASSLVALPSTRIRGIYLLIVTIAVQAVFTVVLLNLSDLTGGPGGVGNVPPIKLYGRALSPPEFLVLAAGAAAVALALGLAISRSGFGILLQAVRDDEIGALALGKNVNWAKIRVFALSGAMAAVAGSLYAHYASYVDPRGFDILVSISVLLMVMLGGAGTIYGPVFGALVVTLLPELLRFIPAPAGSAGAARQLTYGILLIAIVFLRPQGLFGSKARR
jgi:branched-chain amino acid transport system permease protein